MIIVHSPAIDNIFCLGQRQKNLTVQLTLGLYTHLQVDRVTEAINALPDFGKQEAVKTGTDNSIVDAISKNYVKSSATYSDSKYSKHSNTLQSIAKQGENIAQRKNAACVSKNGVFKSKTERRGFEPPEAIVSLRRFSKPLP
jgi:hypothetical protein